jgi:hypothetical protein
MIENIIGALYIGVMVTIGLMLVFLLIALAKSECTYQNQMKICDAIYRYQMHLIEEGRFDEVRQNVTYDDMEDYDATLKRFWDWGYTRILPPEKFELIKPFIRH